MSVSKIDPAPAKPAELDARQVQHLVEACRDFGADSVERMALFQAAAVAARRAPEIAEQEGRLGVLGMTAYWGPAPARLDAYTAATTFLREARRQREASRIPLGASRLAKRVQGGSSRAPYAFARRSARRALMEERIAG